MSCYLKASASSLERGSLEPTYPYLENKEKNCIGSCVWTYLSPQPQALSQQPHSLQTILNLEASVYRLFKNSKHITSPLQSPTG
jgi:hypothetical protein